MLNSAMGYKTPITEAPNHNLFAADLFSTLVEQKSSKNIIFSPVSIQTALGLTFLGAKGDTAEEMRKVLRLGQGDKTRVAENFGDFVRTLSKKQKTTETDAPQLAIANRIYVAEGHRIAPEFNRIALEHFDAEAENVDFYNNEKARYTINKFVEEQTENKIRDLVKPGVLDADTAMVLVNAIYYKGKWKYPFDARRTNEQNFNINTRKQQNVKFMVNEILLNYAELPELDAKVVELPYNNSDITMMLILPNAIEGLEALETKLKNMDLNVISEKLNEKYIRVYLPKFRLEHEVDLKEPLMKVRFNILRFLLWLSNFFFLFYKDGLIKHFQYLC